MQFEDLEFYISNVDFKRRRRRKGEFNNNNNVVDFDVDKFRMLISETLALFPNSDVPKWSLTKEWVEFSKMYFLLPVLKNITSEAPINFSKRIANPFSLYSNRIKIKLGLKIIL